MSTLNNPKSNNKQQQQMDTYDECFQYFYVNSEWTGFANIKIPAFKIVACELE